MLASASFSSDLLVSGDPVSTGDLDGDGDLDLVGRKRVSFIGSCHALMNLTRQVAAPLPAGAGRDYRLEFHARSSARTLQVMVPCLSPGEAHIPLPPFGTFRLDPMRTVVLSPLLVGPPTGMVPLPFPIPADPALVGRSFHVQGLHVTDLAWPPGGWRFTNLLSERIRGL